MLSRCMDHVMNSGLINKHAGCPHTPITDTLKRVQVCLSNTTRYPFSDPVASRSASHKYQRVDSRGITVTITRR